MELAVFVDDLMTLKKISLLAERLSTLGWMALPMAMWVPLALSWIWLSTVALS